MKKIKVGRRHMFVEDVELKDPRTGEQWCLCGRPYGNAVHDLPARTDEEREAETRRYGE